ncbi:MAG: undecaprenyl-diphosphate phosphatase [Candidatus Pacebacteria bacterium]|nr:undecaprenyl-diphosphate phosphatase [Candidatus Paceibacterota bacterium]
MNIFHSIILGIIEGITEFLPISSTGHLILVSSLLKIQNSNSLKSFEIIIQLGAIFAVLTLYLKEFFNLEVIKKISIAFIPTGIIGLTVYKFIKSHLLGNNLIVVLSLIIGGIFMLIVENFYTRKNTNSPKLDDKLKGEEKNNFNIKEISYLQAFYLGLWQSVAMIPGVSRSGATIIGGLLMNLKRETIVKFTFLLAVPTMFAASLLDILKNYKDINENILNISIGFIVAFIFALIFIKWLLAYIQKHNFKIFGWYRIIIAIIFLIILIF